MCKEKILNLIIPIPRTRRRCCHMSLVMVWYILLLLYCYNIIAVADWRGFDRVVGHDQIRLQRYNNHCAVLRL